MVNSGGQPTEISTSEYDFRGRRSGETVAQLVRYHPWLLMPIVLCWIAIALIITVLLWWFGASGYTSLIIAILMLVGLGYSFYTWFIWNGGSYIITNQRVIRSEQIGLFRRQISEAEIDRIQEISTAISGPIHTLLNFGTVHVRTASDSSTIDIENVASPYDIQQMIARIQKQNDVPATEANFSRPRMG